MKGMEGMSMEENIELPQFPEAPKDGDLYPRWMVERIAMQAIAHDFPQASGIELPEFPEAPKFTPEDGDLYPRRMVEKIARQSIAHFRETVSPGRPSTPEFALVRIWVAVMEEIHKRNPRGSRGKRLPMKVSAACRRLCGPKGWRIRADVKGAPDLYRVMSPDTLRNKFIDAERMRHDAKNYPHLHARAALLEKSLPGTFQRLHDARLRMRSLEMRGISPLEWDTH